MRYWTRRCAAIYAWGGEGVHKEKSGLCPTLRASVYQVALPDCGSAVPWSAQHVCAEAEISWLAAMRAQAARGRAAGRNALAPARGV